MCWCEVGEGGFVELVVVEFAQRSMFMPGARDPSIWRHNAALNKT